MQPPPHRHPAGDTRPAAQASVWSLPTWAPGQHCSHCITLARPGAPRAVPPPRSLAAYQSLFGAEARAPLTIQTHSSRTCCSGRGCAPPGAPRSSNARPPAWDSGAADSPPAQPARPAGSLRAKYLELGCSKMLLPESYLREQWSSWPAESATVQPPQQSSTKKVKKQASEQGETGRQTGKQASKQAGRQAGTTLPCSLRSKSASRVLPTLSGSCGTAAASPGSCVTVGAAVMSWNSAQRTRGLWSLQERGGRCAGYCPTLV